MVRTHKFLILVIGLSMFFGRSAEAADWFASVYQFTYETWNQTDCSDASVKELGLLPNCRIGAVSQLHQSLSAVQLKANEIDKTVTQEFFNHGAHVQLGNYACQMKKLKVLTNGSATSDQLLTTYANDLNAKLPLLRAMKAEVVALDEKQKRLKSTRDSLNAYSGAVYAKQVVGELAETEKALARARIQYAAALQTTPLARFPEGLNKVNDLLARPPVEITPHGVWQVHKSELEAVDSRKAWLLEKQTTPGHYQFSQGDKEKLYQNGEPETWLNRSTVGTPAAKGLMCRMNGRYGEGVKDFQTAMFIGSFAFWGGGLGLKAGAQGLRSLTVAVGLRSSAVPVIANYMIAGSYVPTFAYAFKNVETKCSQFALDTYANSCEIDVTKELRVLSKQNCMYALGMLAVNAAFPVVGSPAVKASAARLSDKLKAAIPNR